MKRPAIFFDRDNTLIVSDGYLGDAGKVVLMEGAADAVARARSLGFATVVVSNQSGVARGMFSEDDVDAVNRRMDELLLAANKGAVIDRHEFCPFHPEASVELYRQDSDFRKPKPGMILSAAEKMALDLSRSWLIGDAPRDIEAGQAAGCRTILLRPTGIAESPAAAEELRKPADYVVTSLKEAMDFIDASLNGGDPIPLRPGAAAPTPPAAPQPAPRPAEQTSPTRLEQLTEQILMELRRRNEHALYSDFSVSKLMAGIVQVTALAVVFLSYLYRNSAAYHSLAMFAIFLQTLTIALLIMGRQR